MQDVPTYKKPLIRALLRELKTFYATHGRAHLPWRHTNDPYKILVSELMLQQTQVERVVPFYNRFVKRFPDAKTLSKAKLGDVLTYWQGLGYNRRAKYLYETAHLIAADGFTDQKFPGVGPYTRGAVLAFACNQPTVFIETNIRTAFLQRVGGSQYHPKVVSDQELLPLVAWALKESRMQPRDFYAALMDYGSYLKRQGVKLNHKSKHYTKQSKFKGSARQLRGAIVRELLKRPATSTQLIHNLSRTRGEVERELARLVHEGLLKRVGARYQPG